MALSDSPNSLAALNAIRESNAQVVELLTLVTRQLGVHLRAIDVEREETNKAILAELKLISRQLDQLGEMVS